VNTIKVPEGVDWAALVKNAMDKFNLEIAGGLGPTMGKVWRVSGWKTLCACWLGQCSSYCAWETLPYLCLEGEWLSIVPAAGSSNGMWCVLLTCTLQLLAQPAYMDSPY
jgi:hypothetical protein